MRIEPSNLTNVATATLLVTAVMVGFVDAVEAGTNTTFNPVVTRLTGWTQGSLGKLAGVAGVAAALIGMVAKFDWRLIAGAVGIGLTASSGATLVAGLATATF